MNIEKLINEFFDVKLNKAIESDVRDDEILEEQESTHPAEFEKKYGLELNASEKDTFYNIREEFINHTKSAIANRENEE